MEILKRLRTEKERTQKEIATFLRISQQAYANYESGKRTPDLSVVDQLADYYGVSADYILGRTAEPRPQNPAVHEADDDPDIRVIARARKDMSPAQKKRMMKILAASFEEFFKDDQGTT